MKELQAAGYVFSVQVQRLINNVFYLGHIEELGVLFAVGARVPSPGAVGVRLSLRERIEVRAAGAKRTRNHKIASSASADDLRR
jgi:hypothetical protein